MRQSPEMGSPTIELPPELNALSEKIIGCAIEVHRELGPGLLESLYEEAMCHELTLRGLRYERQHPVQMAYKGHPLRGQRIDLIVEGFVVLELKSVEDIADVFLATLVSYLRAGSYPLGLLINFNVPVLSRGVRRRINSRALARRNAPQTLQTSAPSA